MPPLVFAALVPHPPLLLPALADKRGELLSGTVKALNELAGELYSAKPDVLVVVSQHFPAMPGIFGIGQQPTYQASFEQFGDLSTKPEWRGDIAFAHQLRSTTRAYLPTALVTAETLDYGTAIPLLLLLVELPHLPIVPMGISDLPLAEHAKLGAAIFELAHSQGKRVALLASGDLSHQADQPKGKTFNRKVLNSLKRGAAADLLEMRVRSEELVECALRPLAVLLGAIQDQPARFEVLAFEEELGVGYLTSEVAYS